MNAAILNPVFGLVFGGPLVFGVVAVATRLPDGDGIGWIGTAVVLYVATLVITGVVNVPLNNRLDSTEPPEAARALFERSWVRWNVVRTVLCTLRSSRSRSPSAESLLLGPDGRSTGR